MTTRHAPKYLLSTWIHVSLLFGFCHQALSTHFVLSNGWRFYSYPLIRFASHWTLPATFYESNITSTPQSRKDSVRERRAPAHWCLANKRSSGFEPTLGCILPQGILSSQAFCKRDFWTVSTRRSSSVGSPLAFPTPSRQSADLRVGGSP